MCGKSSPASKEILSFRFCDANDTFVAKIRLKSFKFYDEKPTAQIGYCEALNYSKIQFQPPTQNFISENGNAWRMTHELLLMG